MNRFVRLQVGVRKLLFRDLLSVRFYARRIQKQHLARALTSLVYSKAPYTFPRPRLPYVVAVEPTTYCNLQCIMCPSPGFKSPRGYMSMDVFDKVLREAVAGGMHRIRFIGLGEPLMHPQLPEMIRKAKRGGLYTEVSTNATLLTRELGAALLDAGLDEIGFSLDSADEAEYERIRKGAKFREVIANVDGFLELCAADRRRAPITVARMVVMDRSKIDEFSRRWSGKVDSLQFNPVRLYADTGVARKVKRTLAAAPQPMQLKRKVRCRLILQQLQVAWDGSVGLCSQSSVLVGDVKTASLQDIWNGVVLQKVRSLHEAYEGHRLDVCKVCPVMEPVIARDNTPLGEGQVTTRAYFRDDQIDLAAPRAGGLLQLRRRPQPSTPADSRGL
ncbi:uncharacterized protein SOCE26_066750 [Sorangium cellulosum]|uniref:Radical SAM core domain-containing protein n=1 Tax=Sorangium cellulosum TaxID=56 RepID=A0A2L0F0U7_SORCE|nr:radical SAM protein [Sorangium cellulosum]AUX45194.1 uncharacterized protein SOCE26_066750 [Sorangium cellulosum]